MLPKHIVDRIMITESGWVFLPANDCGWYDEYALRAIALELARRNAELFAKLSTSLADLLEAHDPCILDKLEDDASF